MVRFYEEATGQLDGNSMAEVLGGSAKRRSCRNITEERCILSSICSTAQSPQALKKQVWESMGSIRKTHHRETSCDWVRYRKEKNDINRREVCFRRE